VNRVSFKLGATATVVALCALVLSTAGVGTAAAKPLGSNGVIYACFKAKGKNKGALRVVSSPNGCRKLRGWRPMSWSANSSTGSSGQSGGEGTRGELGQPGPKGDTGTEGKQGTAGQVEKSLTETIQSQTVQINGLTKQVTDLTGDVTDLEKTVGDACDQLEVLTGRSDELLGAIGGLSVNNALQILGGLLEIPTLPAALGTFECT
jgi:hypothetical protein